MKRPMPRRQFLRGAGGAILALPLLPSLSSRAFAACEPDWDHVPKCFFALGTDHGGVWANSMYPESEVLNQQLDYAGRTVRYGRLPTDLDAQGALSLSPLCTAQALTPELSAKFNILRGLDIPYRIGHHQGGFLGNFAQTVGVVVDGVSAGSFLCPTIDQAMAWSPSFYSQEERQRSMTQRSFSLLNGSMSWNFSSPSTRSGQLVSQQHHTNNLDLFRFFFEPGAAYNNVDTFIVDRIKRSYERLTRHPRLSRGDRQRLDQHVERMFEVERKLQVVGALAALPGAPEESTDPYWTHHSFRHDPVENRLYWSLMNDIIVLAFASGVSRVGTCNQTVKFADELINDWHGAVAHASMGPNSAQLWTYGWNRGTFEHVMVDLAAKMDQECMANGTTLLDNSLLMFVQEAGQVTHHTGVVSYPVVTAGSAGGFFNTGLYVDYGNQQISYDDLVALREANPSIELEHPGLYYNQFLANVLQSMGVPREEYEGFTDFRGGNPVPGYGLHHVDPHRADDYAEARLVMGDPLPVITGG